MEKHPPTPESDGCEEEMDGEWNMDDGKVFLMGGGAERCVTKSWVLCILKSKSYH